jgi:hypothetical protein
MGKKRGRRIMRTRRTTKFWSELPFGDGDYFGVDRRARWHIVELTQSREAGRGRFARIATVTSISRAFVCVEYNIC